MAKQTRKGTFYTLLGTIGDILLIPIIVLALTTSLLIFNQQRTYSVPTIFGVGIVRVLSGSMSEYCEEAGRNFDINDKVFIKKSKTFEVGDILAFYDYTDTTADKSEKFELTYTEQKDGLIKKDKDGNVVKNEDGTDATYTNYKYPERDKNGNIKYESTIYNAIKNTKVGSLFTVNGTEYEKLAIPQNRTSVETLKENKSKIYFHQIVQIKIDQTGTIFYITKGNHQSEATQTVREDYVVGKYINTPNWVSDVLVWLSSSTAMIFCVCIPLGILIILETLSLIEQINFAMIEKKLMKGSAYWQDKEVQRLIKTDEMEEVVRILYYMKAPEEDREELLETLWINNGKISKRRQNYLDKVQRGCKILETGTEREYLIYWRNNIKGRWNKRQIENELNKITLDKVIE